MADVAFDAVKLVVNFIREEARLEGRAGDDVRFIMDEMESMNNLLHQLVSMTKPNNHDTAGGGSINYSHLRTWMKQLLELAFDSRNSVELYIQSGDSHCCWLPWAMVARHRVVSQIRELKERAREISERQMRYGGGLLPAQRQDGNTEEAGDRSAVSNSNQRPRRAHAGSSSAVRRAILDGEFVDNSSVDEVLRRLNVLINSNDDGSSGDESSDNDIDSDGEPPMLPDVGDKQQQSDGSDKQQQSDGSDKKQQQQQQTMLPGTSGKKQQADAGDKQQQTQSDTGDKKQQSDGRDKQPQQQPMQSDTGDKKQQSDAAVKPQQQPMLLDTGDKQQQSDTSDKKQQSDTGDKQQQPGAGDKQPEPTPSDTGYKRQQSDSGDMEEQRSDVGDKQLDGREKKKQQGIRVVTILVQDGTDEAAVGETVLKRYRRLRLSDTNMSWKYKGQVLHVSVRRPPVLSEIKVQIANQAKKQQIHMERPRFPYRPYSRNSQAFPAAGDDEFFKDEKKAEEFIKNYSSGQRLLLVLSGLSCPKILDDLKSFLCGLSKGRNSCKFAIVLCTNDKGATEDCSYPATDNESQIKYSLVDIYLERAVALLPGSYNDDMSSTVRGILKECSPDEVCMKMILHALYYNPDMTNKEMERLKKSLVATGHQEKGNQIITFFYQKLPNDYKNCLWYTAVFTRGISTPGRSIRRASLLRRWIAQGLITEENEANHCFDAMVEWKLINPHQVSGTGKIKSCAVQTSVDDLIKRDSPTVEDLLLNNQLPIENLDLLVSIRNGMQLQPANSSISRFLNSMSSKSMLLLRVLDLEGRNDLKPKDLWTLCKIGQLKYLSLRNTNVAHLPKQIGQLENLETLDIRGTKVLVFNRVLPKLKHLLAGRIIDYQDHDTDIIKSKESFSTVCMPRSVETMEKLEILSRVKVTNSSKELINVGDKLEHLKKLGVVLSGKKACLKELFLQIEKLNRCLRSLSIRMEPPGSWDAADVILLRPPKLLESLHICSIRRGLPPRIKELHHLAKITLRDTFLKQDDLCVIGLLPKLRYLRLFYHSFGEGTITFGNSVRYPIYLDFEVPSFKNLTDIAIEDDTITSVTLNILPKLEKITWSFSYMESLSGVQNLQSLTHLVLNGGSYNQEGLQTLQRDIDRNGIDFKIDPPQRGEESRVVGPAPW